MGRKRVLDVWMWKRPTLGDGRVESGGGKLLAVTHRNPGLHAEREIERWEDARRRGRLSLGFRGKKTCGSGELDAKKGGSHGLGRVQGTQAPGSRGKGSWAAERRDGRGDLERGAEPAWVAALLHNGHKDVC